MPRGAPDYSNVRVDNPLHRSDDMAELAARLGSPCTHNRGGNVIFIEDFERGIASWHKAAEGTGANAFITAEQARSGAFSCKLIGGKDGNKSMKINRKFPYPVLNRYGVEFSILFEAHTTAIHFALARHDGTNEHQFRIRYDPDDGTLKCYDGAAVFTQFADDVYLAQAYSPFNTFKLIVDLVNDRYGYLIVNERTFDLTEYEPYIFETPDSPNIRFDIILYSDTGYNGFSYIDDIIITQNEP